MQLWSDADEEDKESKGAGGEPKEVVQMKREGGFRGQRIAESEKNRDGGDRLEGKDRGKAGEFGHHGEVRDQKDPQQNNRI